MVSESDFHSFTFEWCVMCETEQSIFLLKTGESLRVEKYILELRLY
jgi:hypothetical protein